MIEKGEMGMVKISKKVIGEMAARAAMEVKGVVGIGGGLFYRFLKAIRIRPFYRVRVEIISNRDVEISIPLIVAYGSEISSIAYEVQEKVKTVVEDLTGLDIVKVDVNVETIG